MAKLPAARVRRTKAEAQQEFERVRREAVTEREAADLAAVARHAVSVSGPLRTPLRRASRVHSTPDESGMMWRHLALQ